MELGTRGVDASGEVWIRILFKFLSRLIEDLIATQRTRCVFSLKPGLNAFLMETMLALVKLKCRIFFKWQTTDRTCGLFFLQLSMFWLGLFSSLLGLTDFLHH